jgi:hypothetical protein
MAIQKQVTMELEKKWKEAEVERQKKVATEM